MSIDVKRLKVLKSHMSEEQKKKLLVGLRRLREELGENPEGGNMITTENEFTAASRPEPKVIAKTFDTNSDFDSYVNQRRGIEMTPKERQTIVVMTEGLGDPVQQQQQQSGNEPSKDEMTIDDKIRVQKSITFVDETQGADILASFLAELELDKQKPTSGDKFFLKYEVTDSFGKNSTTVIKKLKEGSQFCWTAFSKYEDAEEEGHPEPEGDEA